MDLKLVKYWKNEIKQSIIAWYHITKKDSQLCDEELRAFNSICRMARAGYKRTRIEKNIMPKIDGIDLALSDLNEYIKSVGYGNGLSNTTVCKIIEVLTKYKEGMGKI